jgi:hypothetical protein
VAVAAVAVAAVAVVVAVAVVAAMTTMMMAMMGLLRLWLRPRHLRFHLCRRRPGPVNRYGHQPLPVYLRLGRVQANRLRQHKRRLPAQP